MVMPSPDGSYMLFAKLGTVLGDELGLKQMWSVKGSSGVKPCMLCCNVVLPRCEWAHIRPNVDTTCLDDTKFILHTDETIRHGFIRTLQPGLSKKRREELEKAHGVTIAPHLAIMHPLLQNIALPASCTVYDFMHVYLSSGIFNEEMWSFMQAAKRKVGLRFQVVDQYLQPWQWPEHNSNLPKHLFNAKHFDADHNADIFKASASELLSLYPVMRYFIRAMLFRYDLLRAEILSFFALCDVLDGYMIQQNGRPLHSWHLRIRRHLELSQAAYGPSTKIKPHFALHLQSQAMSHSRLFTTFALERKHKFVKQLAAQRCNYRTFEVGLLQKLLLDQINGMHGNFETGTFLITPTPRSFTELFEGDVMVAKQGSNHGNLVTAGDIAYFDTSTGEVIAKIVLLVQGTPRDVAESCLDSWCLAYALAYSGTHGLDSYHVENELQLFSLRGLVTAAVWCKAGPCVRVLPRPV